MLSVPSRACALGYYTVASTLLKLQLRGNLKADIGIINSPTLSISNENVRFSLTVFLTITVSSTHDLKENEHKLRDIARPITISECESIGGCLVANIGTLGGVNSLISHG